MRAAVPWHALDAATAAARLGTNIVGGLTPDEAAHRLAADGPNALAERGQRTAWHILADQFRSLLVVILLAGLIISVALGDLKDAAVIGAVVLLNALLGFTQEHRAERAMAALKRLSVPVVRVRRGGRAVDVSAVDLVAGDVLLLETGNLVPADARLVECPGLRVREAALTGESEPVDKSTAPLSSEAIALGDRRNMVYRGTMVVAGRAVALVTATGMATELGRIASLLQTVAPQATPLQKRLDQLGRILAVVALALVGVVFAGGLVRGEDVRLLLMTAVGMAVAAVPEGLPAVVTVALALAAQRMLRRRALVRRLSAVETLGSVTVICSDKTGTLTQNRMAVSAIELPGLASSGPIGDAPIDGAHNRDRAATLLLVGGALCGDATLREDGGGCTASGDPTEAALVVAAARTGLRKPELERWLPRVSELPFDSDRKRMTTVHALRIPTGGASEDAADTVCAHLQGALLGLREGSAAGQYVAFTKGAVDSLLHVTRSVWTEDGPAPLDAALRARISAANDRLAQRGMRVLGVALRALGPTAKYLAPDEAERDLTFVGIVGLLDPPRPEAREAVLTSRAAGIRPVMITGDHPLTAQYVAAELGIAKDSVFARVAPEEKLDIVQALQEEGHVVAMTGDGVNDAPALKRADVGVAMGITGTDVSKEAADIVLLDDNFATIVAAVEEGRTVYDNVRKFVRYMMTTNSAELWVMLAAPFLGLPLPLLPLQILWINLVTDGPAAVALAFEPAEPNTMHRPPRPPSESVFAHGMGWHIAWVGALMASLTLGVGLWYWRAGLETWRTAAFTALVFAQMGNVLAVRSERASLFSLGIGTNRPLLAAVAATLLLQAAVVYVPALGALFETTPLSPSAFLITLAVGGAIFCAVEVEKWWRRSRPRGTSLGAQRPYPHASTR